MAFTFESVAISDAKQELATTRESQLSKFCERITSALQDMGEDFEYVRPMSLDALLMQDTETQDWNLAAQERFEKNGGKNRAITVDAIVRKINESKDETDVRAIRKDGRVAFVRNSSWTEKDEKELAASEAE